MISVPSELSSASKTASVPMPPNMPALPLGRSWVQPAEVNQLMPFSSSREKTRPAEVHVTDLGAGLNAGDEVEVGELLDVLVQGRSEQRCILSRESDRALEAVVDVSGR